MKGKFILLTGSAYLLLARVSGVYAEDPVIRVREGDLGFKIPSMSVFLSFLIKFFFVLAGLLALFYMLWGAISWVTSGGDPDAVGKARDKIVAAAVGVILIVATLSLIAALEQIVFQQRVCFGITCDLRLPTLLEPCDDVDGDGACDADPELSINSIDTVNADTGTSAESVSGVSRNSAGGTNDSDTLPATGR
jgi:hypothetical protein